MDVFATLFRFLLLSFIVFLLVSLTVPFLIHSLPELSLPIVLFLLAGKVTSKPHKKPEVDVLCFRHLMCQFSCLYLPQEPADEQSQPLCLTGADSYPFYRTDDPSFGEVLQSWQTEKICLLSSCGRLGKVGAEGRLHTF